MGHDGKCESTRSLLKSDGSNDNVGARHHVRIVVEDATRISRVAHPFIAYPTFGMESSLCRSLGPPTPPQASHHVFARQCAPVPANHLLASLPHVDRQRLIVHCDEVDLVESDVLCERGDRIDHVYFPIRSFISLITPIDPQAGFEIGMVGMEGMHGISLALGVDVSPQRAIVQGTGSALRMDAAAFRRELARSASLRRFSSVTSRAITSTAPR